MEHKHGVYDSDTRFSINSTTRQIKSDPKHKTTLMQNDHNSERFTFELPRYIEQHDMSLCNQVEVHYLNSDAKDKNSFRKGLYTVEDLQINPDDPEKVVCSWLISQNATQLVGKLSFRLRFKCVEDGVITYAWHTAINADISVSDGINADESFEMDYVDIIEQWKEAVRIEFAQWHEETVAEMSDEITAWKEVESGKIRGEMTAFSAQWNDALNVERKRIDQFVALPEGSTAGDAELMDIRVGADGNTYDTAGEAVRGQFNHFVKSGNAVADELRGVNNYQFSIIPSVLILGYYDTDMELKAYDSGYKSRITGKIPCKPGEVYSYYGHSTSDSPCARFYGGDAVIGVDDTVVGGSPYFDSHEITIPEGCTHAVFASVASGAKLVDEDVLFDCRLKGSKTINEKLNELDKYHAGFIEKYINTSFTETVGILEVNGNLNDTTSYHCKYTNKILCEPGDVFIYTGVGRASGVSAIFYSDDTINSYYQNGATSPSTSEVIIPDGCNYVVFSSFAKVGTDVVLTVVHKDFHTLHGLSQMMGEYIAALEAQSHKDNVLWGKKYVACGDSFTWGGSEESTQFEDGLYAGCNKVYPYFIGDRNNMNVINLATGGQTMCNISGTRENAFSNGIYLNIPEDADYITLKFGINDVNYDSPVGDIDDTDTSTFCGAWNVVLEHIIANHPYAKIGIIVTNGATAKYTEPTRLIARKWGIPTLDEAADYNVPLLNRVNEKTDICKTAITIRNEAFRVSETDRHPNDKSHEYESTFVEHFLRSL